MQNIRTFTQRELHFWRTADGRELDIQTMADDHIWNCINLLTTKLHNFTTIPKGYKSVTSIINEIKQDRADLLCEMDRRHRKGIEIER